MSSSGGPLPPTTVTMRAPLVWMSERLKPSSIVLVALFLVTAFSLRTDAARHNKPKRSKKESPGAAASEARAISKPKVCRLVANPEAAPVPAAVGELNLAADEIAVGAGDVSRAVEAEAVAITVAPVTVAPMAVAPGGSGGRVVESGGAEDCGGAEREVRVCGT